MMDAFADPELRLRALVFVFATAAGVRLIRARFSAPERRWSFITGAALIALVLVREVPRFLDCPAPALFSGESLVATTGRDISEIPPSDR